VLLSVDPAYVGATGAARLLDMAVRTFAAGPDGVDIDDLTRALARARADGLRPRAIYLVPDFANPTGVRLPLHLRCELLALAAREDVLVLEDNPYGLFPLGAERLPTLKALDTERRVVYLGSLSKSVFPGGRVGFAVADQLVDDGLRLADHLGRLKSMLTVNTSPLAQAVVGGALLEHGCSLRRARAREAEVYRRGMTRLLDGLARRFPAPSPVTWTAPAGGFFVVVTVPFDVTDAHLEMSAGVHQVLWTPLHHFYRRAARCGSCGCRAVRSVTTTSTGPWTGSRRSSPRRGGTRPRRRPAPRRPTGRTRGEAAGPRPAVRRSCGAARRGRHRRADRAGRRRHRPGNGWWHPVPA
jgi:(S)-3,5-dihydroxyphenylglycine transaminase